MLLTEEIREVVEQAMEQLPEDLRTAIVLRELEGLSYEEIAEAMDCPVGTVRSRIFRAREAIDKQAASRCWIERGWRTAIGSAGRSTGFEAGDVDAVERE